MRVHKECFDTLFKYRVEKFTCLPRFFFKSLLDMDNNLNMVKLYTMLLPKYKVLQVQRADRQKHSGIILDEKLNFKYHRDKVLTKTSKGLAVIKR